MPVPAPSAILLAAASIGLIVGRNFRLRSGRFWGAFFLIGTSLTAGCLLTETFALNSSSGNQPDGSSWINDPLSRAEQWIIVSWGLLISISLFDSTRLDREKRDTPGFLLFVLAGLILVATSNDFITLALSLDIVSLASVAMWRSTERSRWQSGPIWFAALASGGLWLGIGILSNTLATTHFDQIRLVLIETYDPVAFHDAIGAPSKLVLLSIGLIVISLMARMGMVPFHFSFLGLRRSNSLWLTGFAMQTGHLAGLIALTRLLGYVFVGVNQSLITLLMIPCLITLIIASLMSIRGFSPGMKSVSLWITGFMLLDGAIAAIGLMAITSELERPGVRWAVLHAGYETIAILIYSQLAGLLAFNSLFGNPAISSSNKGDIEFLEDLKGLGRVSPWPALALLLSLASLIGCPLTAGFWSRWMILLSAANVHMKSTSAIFTPLAAMRCVMTAAVITTILFAVVVANFARELFLESPLAKPANGHNKGALISCLISTIAILALGFAPQTMFLPLKSLTSPREIRPVAPQRGSGKNSLGVIQNPVLWEGRGRE